MVLEQAVNLQYGIYRPLEETYGKWLKLKNAVILSKLFFQYHISLWTCSDVCEALDIPEKILHKLITQRMHYRP